MGSLWVMVYPDNVKRKEAFVQKHPEWSISFNRAENRFEAEIETEEGAKITDMELGRLIDKLEVVAGEQS